MFDLFRKNNPMEKLIVKDGIDYVADGYAKVIAKKLTRQDIAYQFILEELDAASKGNAMAKTFAAQSGIPAVEYIGSLDNSMPEVDGPDGPQQQLLRVSFELAANEDLMVEFRCKVDDKIMRHFGFGKYGSQAADHEQNYFINKAGFKIKDGETRDVLECVLDRNQFHARVTISDMNLTLPLAPWPVLTNPFQDDHEFAGAGRSPQGPWSFTIRPSAPFSSILAQVEKLNHLR